MILQHLLLLFFLFITHFQLFSQLGVWMSDNVKNHTPTPIFRIETRGAFIAQNNVKTINLQAGLKFGSQLKLGFSYHFLTRGSSLKLSNEGKVKLNYVAPFLEYDFFQKGRYKASIPILLGFGKVSIHSSDGKRSLPIIFYEAILVGQYHLMKYLDVGLGIGYRMALLNNNAYDLNFYSPIYTLKTNIYFLELYQAIKKKR